MKVDPFLVKKIKLSDPTKKKKFLSDEKIALAHIERVPSIFSDFDPLLIYNPAFIMKAIKKNPRVIINVDSSDNSFFHKHGDILLALYTLD